MQSSWCKRTRTTKWTLFHLVHRRYIFSRVKINEATTQRFPAIAGAANDAWRVRNFLRLTARQRCGTSSTRDTARLLGKATPAFIPSIIWPMYSPDINPVEYKIWGTVQQRVYRSHAQNVDEQRCLRGLEQNIIESTTSELCGRFKAFVKGGMDISNKCSASINNPFNN